jgi:cell wall-associated NlpC family hydrolase
VNAKWGSVDHVGMAISPQLFIHASSQGVFLSRWDEGYYRDRTAFGKRILPF